MKIEENSGDTLQFLIAYPDDYSESSKYPLIVMLHGYGAHMGDLASLAPRLHESGYIFAFPNAPLRVDFGGGSWGYSWLPQGDSVSASNIQHAEELVLNFVRQVAHRLAPAISSLTAWLLQPSRSWMGESEGHAENGYPLAEGPATDYPQSGSYLSER